MKKPLFVKKVHFCIQQKYIILAELRYILVCMKSHLSKTCFIVLNVFNILLFVQILNHSSDAFNKLYSPVFAYVRV